MSTSRVAQLVECMNFNVKVAGPSLAASNILPYYNLFTKTLMCVHTAVNLVGAYYSVLSS